MDFQKFAQFLIKHWFTLGVIVLFLLPATLLGLLWVFSLDWPLAIGVSIIIGIGAYGYHNWFD